MADRQNNSERAPPDTEKAEKKKRAREKVEAQLAAEKLAAENKARAEAEAAALIAAEQAAQAALEADKVLAAVQTPLSKNNLIESFEAAKLSTTIAEAESTTTVGNSPQLGVSSLSSTHPSNIQQPKLQWESRMESTKALEK